MTAFENSVLKLLTRKAPTKWGHILGELQSAIHLYTQRLRHRTAAILLRPAEVSPDRRKASRDRRRASFPTLNPKARWISSMERPRNCLRHDSLLAVIISRGT
jgi:hypothetical protein